MILSENYFYLWGSTFLSLSSDILIFMHCCNMLSLIFCKINVDQSKILGTIVKTNLSRDDNCHELVKKVNARMQLLKGVQIFGA